MPFRFPFSSPFGFPFNMSSHKYSSFNKINYNMSHSNDKINFSQKKNDIPMKQVLCDINCSTKKASEADNASEAFFEVFGLKLYFDDILIICILFFLYTEGVHNDELFICLILLLLS